MSVRGQYLRESPRANQGLRNAGPCLGRPSFPRPGFLRYHLGPPPSLQPAAAPQPESAPDRDPLQSRPRTEPRPSLFLRPPPPSHLCACATGKFAKVPDLKAAVSGSRLPPRRQTGAGAGSWTRTALRPRRCACSDRWARRWPCCATTAAAASASTPRAIPTVRETRPPALRAPPPPGGRPRARGVRGPPASLRPAAPDRGPPGPPHPRAAPPLRADPAAGAWVRRPHPGGGSPRGCTCFPAAHSLIRLELRTPFPPASSPGGSKRQPGAPGLPGRLIRSDCVCVCALYVCVCVHCMYVYVFAIQTAAQRLEDWAGGGLYSCRSSFV